MRLFVCRWVLCPPSPPVLLWGRGEGGGERGAAGLEFLCLRGVAWRRRSAELGRGARRRVREAQELVVQRGGWGGLPGRGGLCAGRVS